MRPWEHLGFWFCQFWFCQFWFKRVRIKRDPPEIEMFDSPGWISEAFPAGDVRPSSTKGPRDRTPLTTRNPEMFNKSLNAERCTERTTRIKPIRGFCARFLSPQHRKPGNSDRRPKNQIHSFFWLQDLSLGLDFRFSDVCLFDQNGWICTGGSRFMQTKSRKTKKWRFPSILKPCIHLHSVVLLTSMLTTYLTCMLT